MSSHEPTFKKPRLALLKRWLREPLLHFLVAGLALFAVYRAFNPPAPGRDNPRRIDVTNEDIRQLDVIWMAKWQRHPTPEEMRALVDGKVREEILYREALALGLDQGDTIVKRRMAQKMEFLIEDVAALKDPTDQELKVWFDHNPSRFALPARVTFRHLYFSPDKRRRQAREDAVRALTALATHTAGSPEAINLCDRFMFQDYYADRTPEHVANVFGNKFAEAVFKLKPGAWQGPIESGLGWHVVWVDSQMPGRVPAFEELDASAIKSEWIAEQRVETKSRALEEMKGRYEIVLPRAATQEVAVSTAASAKEAR